MKVSQIIKLCSEMSDLQLTENIELYDSREAMQDDTIRKLITCCNSVLEDLYCNYGAETVTCGVVCKNGFIDTSALCLNRVIKLVNSYGENAKYRYTAEGLRADDGEYTLTYAKLPPKVIWEEEVILPSPRLTERILAYGMLSEYYLAMGDLQISAMWEKRYQDALHSASIKSSSMSMPKRTWI